MTDPTKRSKTELSPTQVAIGAQIDMNRANVYRA